ncbi:hypothetical protein P3377_08805 [Vibrio parahaemolyticus]|nr:hypothetical protein [Vibrio parahaemolyticus]HAS6628208.1 hypothetical protein [Vibrio parahaemolyticus]
MNQNASVVKNSFIIIIASFFNKLLTLASQIYLGRELSIESFSHYASVLGIVSVVIWMKNGAVIQLAIKDKIEKGNIDLCYKWAKITNVVAFYSIILISLFYIRDIPIFLLLIAFSINVLFSHFGLSNRVHFVASNKINNLARYDLGFSFFYVLSTIIAAFIFRDERAFFFGLIMMTLYDALFFYKLKVIHKDIELKKCIINMLPIGKWLLLGSLGATLVMQGSYLILHNGATIEIIAGFYFAFQLVAAFSLLLGEAIRKVVMPFFVINNQDFSLYKKGVLITSTLAIALTMSTVPLVPSIVDYLWDGKWNYVIKTVEIFYITLFLSLIISISYAKLESEGRFKSRSILQVLDGCLLISSVLLSISSNDLYIIAIFVAIRRFIFGLIQIYVPFYYNKEKGYFMLACNIVFCFSFGCLILWASKILFYKDAFSAIFSSLFVFFLYIPYVFFLKKYIEK